MPTQLPKNVIIPAILAHSKKEFLEKLEIIRKSVKQPKLLQIDVADGKFVENKTWGNPAQIAALKLDIPFEVHLMVQKPERAYGKWVEAGASRIVIHFEATGDIAPLAETIKAVGVKAILAINPETKVSQLPLNMKDFYAILVMGVHPGFGGQKQLAGTVAKLRALRKKYPSIRIEVDGGVNNKNADKLLEAGATELVMGSAYGH